MSYRDQRFSSTIKHSLANILLNTVKDESLRFTSIIEVMVSPDLKIARVYVHSSRLAEKELLLKLERAKGYLRKNLAKEIYAKFIPDLFFVYAKDFPNTNLIENKEGSKDL